MNIKERADDKLMQLGFTKSESDVYLYLLTEGANTGYAVAKGIGKAVANVYKAIDSLAKKGAVEQTSGKNKLCIAVDWQQLIASESTKFKANIDSLAKCLEALPTKKNDEQVYQIQNAEHVKELSVSLIEKAKHILLADLEPKTLDWVKQPLIEAAERGVEVRVKVYEPVVLPGVITTLRMQGQQVYTETDDINFSICSDGNEMLTALLTSDSQNVIQAFRSQSALLTLTFYNKLLYELVLTELKEVIPKGEIERAQEILINTEHLHPFSNKNVVCESFQHRYKNLRNIKGKNNDEKTD